MIVVWLLSVGIVFVMIRRPPRSTCTASLVPDTPRFRSDRRRPRAGSRLARVGAEFRDNGFSYLLFLRLVPAFPFWLVNIAPAMIGMPLGRFMAATALGILQIGRASCRERVCQYV